MNKTLDELIGRAFHGRLSGPEKDWLDAWRAASARNDAYYGDLVRLLRAVADAALDRASAPPSDTSTNRPPSSREPASEARPPRNPPGGGALMFLGPRWALPDSGASGLWRRITGPRAQGMGAGCPTPPRWRGKQRAAAAGGWWATLLGAALA